ncbi:hypothetical protein G7048_08280 [Diaphorobacter sp. HDW4B]|uniref:hypothetical protein n=1 Tax=Diaphorobacter sp. HDW4B TaxID=2714925 RepID=UPI00140DB9FC|nr:hypothetical protein [Diaphorobacter sp. HDW4B]QIL70349.1 hypothetical protein G7048_08280 [Diaphorobacter sp. HDW4B]
MVAALVSLDSESHPAGFNQGHSTTASHATNAPTFARSGVEASSFDASSRRDVSSDPNERSLERWNDLLRQTGLDPLWLKSHGFTPGSEALQRLHGLLDGNASVLSANAMQIAFGPQGGGARSITGETPSLSTHERYVDATLSIPGQGTDSVLVRWRNVSDNSVLDLSVQALPSGSGGSVPLWMYSPVDWPPGRYRVEVLSPDTGLGLLAAGEFEVAPTGATVTPFAHEMH